MPTFQIYNVTPILPAALEPLREMSFNLWWTWEPAARRLFRHLDPELWNRTNHNPVRMLQLSRQSRLEELAQDKIFLRELKDTYDAFQKYLARKDTYGKMGAGSAIKKPIAYFSAELFRRFGNPGRRPLQISERSRSELRRNRIALSAWLFPAGDRQGRRSARGQSEPKLSSPADPRSAA